ncbi:site-specific integrase [Paraburkholderia graminis]|uniref:site-specific integrase n=1 Tax=Paraburkholderia graminis TaxID=60548 RepID=UPI0038B6D61F
MHKLPRLLKSRHGVYYLRICQGELDTRRSLGTKDFRQAKLAALLLNLQVEMNKTILNAGNVRRLDVVFPNGVQFNNIKQEETGMLFQILDRLGMTSEQMLSLTTEQLAKTLAGPNPQKIEPAKPKSKLLSEVIALYLAEKRLDNVPKTIDDKERTFTEFHGFFENKDINTYGADSAVSYKNRLIASNHSASRINAKTSFLKDLFAYAIDNNLYFQTNPFEKVRVSRKSKLKQQVESYRDFTDDDLKLIFDKEPYRAFMNKPDYHWLPFLALYTGARVEELASLKLSQIRHESGVWYFEIEQAKNRNSIRKIPLHKAIERSGFLAYVEGLRTQNKEMLFPHLKDGKNGYSKNMSRRFGQYLDKLKFTDDRKVFHSFRHTFINRMTEMHTHPAMLMAIVGHYEQTALNLSSPHFVNYQHEKQIVTLKRTVDLLEFPITLFW